MESTSLKLHRFAIILPAASSDPKQQQRPGTFHPGWRWAHSTILIGEVGSTFAARTKGDR